MCEDFVSGKAVEACKRYVQITGSHLQYADRAMVRLAIDNHGIKGIREVTVDMARQAALVEFNEDRIHDRNILLGKGTICYDGEIWSVSRPTLTWWPRQLMEVLREHSVYIHNIHPAYLDRTKLEQVFSTGRVCGDTARDARRCMVTLYKDSREAIVRYPSVDGASNVLEINRGNGNVIYSDVIICQIYGAHMSVLPHSHSMPNLSHSTNHNAPGIQPVHGLLAGPTTGAPNSAGNQQAAPAAGVLPSRYPPAHATAGSGPPGYPLAPPSAGFEHLENPPAPPVAGYGPPVNWPAGNLPLENPPAPPVAGSEHPVNPALSIAGHGPPENRPASPVAGNEPPVNLLAPPTAGRGPIASPAAGDGPQENLQALPDAGSRSQTVPTGRHGLLENPTASPTGVIGTLNPMNPMNPIGHPGNLTEVARSADLVDGTSDLALAGYSEADFQDHFPKDQTSCCGREKKIEVTCITSCTTQTFTDSVITNITHSQTQKTMLVSAKESCHRNCTGVDFSSRTSQDIASNGSRNCFADNGRNEQTELKEVPMLTCIPLRGDDSNDAPMEDDAEHRSRRNRRRLRGQIGEAEGHDSWTEERDEFSPEASSATRRPADDARSANRTRPPDKDSTTENANRRIAQPGNFHRNDIGPIQECGDDVVIPDTVLSSMDCNSCGNM